MCAHNARRRIIAVPFLNRYSGQGASMGEYGKKKKEQHNEQLLIFIDGNGKPRCWTRARSDTLHFGLPAGSEAPREEERVVKNYTRRVVFPAVATRRSLKPSLGVVFFFFFAIARECTGKSGFGLNLTLPRPSSRVWSFCAA